MGFSRQEYRSGLPFPSPGDLPNPGIEPKSLISPALQVDSLPLAPPGKSPSSVVDFQEGLKGRSQNVMGTMLFGWVRRCSGICITGTLKETEQLPTL